MHEIISRFATLRMSLESHRIVIVDPPNIEGYLDLSLQLLRTHADAHRRFYQEFNYDWTLDPSSYTDDFGPLACQYQYYLMVVLADIPRQHPDHNKLGNIAIRFLKTGDLNGYCVADSDYKFIILSTTFVKFLQEILVALHRLSRIGAQSAPPPADITAIGWTTSDHLWGRTIERALRTNGEGCRPHLDRLLDVALAFSDYSQPTAAPVRLREELPLALDREPLGLADTNLAFLYESVEVFVICHELGHILLHGGLEKHSNDAKEEEADRAAASLYLIHNAHNMKNPLGFLIGPAAFFQAMRLFIMCRRALAGLDLERADISRDVEEAEHLRVRMLLYDSHNKEFGVMPRDDGRYREILLELELLIAACTIRLLERLGKPTVPTLDELRVRVSKIMPIDIPAWTERFRLLRGILSR